MLKNHMAENNTFKKDDWWMLAALAVIIGGIIFFSTPSPKSAQAGDVSKAYEACKELSNKEGCYVKFFEQLTQAHDWQYSFSILRELQRKDPEANGCHFIAHGITRAETEKDTSKWREIMNAAPPDCSYGAAHGALEAYADTFPGGKLPESQWPTVCDNPDYHNCTHALGHLLLVLTENNIPRSLAQCDSLPHNDYSKFECITGVFMERITAINLEIHGLATKEALNWPARVPELEALCREQTPGSNYSAACWKEIVHAVLIKVHDDPQQLVNFCEMAPGERETRECIDHSIGIMAAGGNFDFSSNRHLCDVRVKATDYKERCYTGLISSTLSTIPTKRGEAERFCASLEPAYQDSCQKRITLTQQALGD